MRLSPISVEKDTISKSTPSFSSVEDVSRISQGYDTISSDEFSIAKELISVVKDEVDTEPRNQRQRNNITLFIIHCSTL